eukprot:6459596-Amphidinium_carterae.1
MKAEYRSKMMNKELIEPLTPDMPELMSVQPERRYHRFRMCKARLMSEDHMNEVAAEAKRRKEDEARIADEKEQAEGQILQCTVEAVARLHDASTRPQDSDPEDEAEDDDDEDETGTVAEGMSPKNYLDVDPMASDPLTLPHLTEALKKLEDFDVDSAIAAAQKSNDETNALAASLSTAIAAATPPKSRDRTLPVPGMKTKKAKKNVVKLTPTALSAIDEVASVSSSFQSLEDEVAQDDDEPGEAKVDAPNQEGS